MRVNAKEIVGNGFPPDEGKRLADALLTRQDVTWNDLEIDLTACTPALLISAFFNGFLQEVFEKKKMILDDARKIKWHLQFPFQNDNVKRWMSDFKPFVRDDAPRA